MEVEFRSVSEETPAIEARVRDALDSLGIDYEVLPCEPELADTKLFCAHYRIALEDSANAILVASKREPRQFSLSIVLATTRLDVNRRLRELMGVKRLSFATAEETMALTGMMVGGVTPFGLPEAIPIYVDRGVQARSRVVLGGGSRSSKIRVEPSALERLPEVRVVDGLALPTGGD
jgi:prolyl-tRNA editing enzyme YbaK/EbsC (Cys-tRNA(Pro) deacylase)